MGEIENRNKSIIMQVGEAQSSGRLDLLDELLAHDFVRHCQATPWLEVRSREDFKRFLEADRSAVPDGRVTPRLLIAEGDYVALWAGYSGTQTGAWGLVPPSNKRFELDVGMVFRLSEGRVAEMWVTWDNLSMLMQLGHWSPPGGQG
jgi:predicted ester cyclase